MASNGVTVFKDSVGQQVNNASRGTVNGGAAASNQLWVEPPKFEATLFEGTLTEKTQLKVDGVWTYRHTLTTQNNIYADKKFFLKGVGNINQPAKATIQDFCSWVSDGFYGPIRTCIQGIYTFVFSSALPAGTYEVSLAKSDCSARNPYTGVGCSYACSWDASGSYASYGNTTLAAPNSTLSFTFKHNKSLISNLDYNSPAVGGVRNQGICLKKI